MSFMAGEENSAGLSKGLFGGVRGSRARQTYPWTGLSL